MKRLSGLSVAELYEQLPGVRGDIKTLWSRRKNDNCRKQLKNLLIKNRKIQEEIGRQIREEVNNSIGFKFFREDGMYTTEALRIMGGAS